MRFLLIGYFFFLPFQWALSPAPGIDLALIRVVTIFLVVGWFGRGLLVKKMVIPLGLSSFFLVGFLLWAGFSILWAENTVFGERKWLFLCSFLPLFLVLLAWLRENREQMMDLLRAFVGGAFLVALSGLLLFTLQFVVGVERIFTFLTTALLPFFLGGAFGGAVAAYPSLLVNISQSTLLRASGVFPDPHMFSLYLGMAAPISFVLFLQSSSKKKLWLFIFCTILVADLLSFSRGGYVGLILGGTFFLVSIRSSLYFGKQQLFWIVTGVIGLMLLFFLSPLGPRLLSSFSGEDGSITERLRLWQEAVEHISERPLLGVGLGNYPLLVKPSASYREPIYAHNLFLDITLELGFVGLGLFLGLVGLALIRVWRVWRERRSLVPLSLAASLVVFLGHAFFESPLFSVHVLPVLLLLLAIGVSYKYDESSS